MRSDEDLNLILALDVTKEVGELDLEVRVNMRVRLIDKKDTPLDSIEFPHANNGEYVHSERQ